MSPSWNSDAVRMRVAASPPGSDPRAGGSPSRLMRFHVEGDRRATGGSPGGEGGGCRGDAFPDSLKSQTTSPTTAHFCHFSARWSALWAERPRQPRNLRTATALTPRRARKATTLVSPDASAPVCASRGVGEDAAGVGVMGVEGAGVVDSAGVGVSGALGVGAGVSPGTGTTGFDGDGSGVGSAATLRT